MTRGSASCRRRATVAPPAPSSSVSDAPGGLVRAIDEVFQGGVPIVLSTGKCSPCDRIAAC